MIYKEFGCVLSAGELFFVDSKTGVTHSLTELASRKMNLIQIVDFRELMTDIPKKIAIFTLEEDENAPIAAQG